MILILQILVIVAVVYVWMLFAFGMSMAHSVNSDTRRWWSWPAWWASLLSVIGLWVWWLL